jgi:hypothetical protein
MAQSGFTPILIYSSSTASQAPSAGNLTNSTLGSELAINITDGKLFYKDNANNIQVIGWKVVPATAGGTGQTSYAVGDLLYADTTTSLAKLADVATGNALISGGVGVAPSWGKIGLTTHVSGVLPVANGGTNASTASITAFNNITGYTASGATGTTSTNLVFSTSPTLTTPIVSTTLGVGGATPAASGSGITFPATESASTDPNTLDDYEEGTWTPVYTPQTGSFTTINYGTQLGTYRKIGNIVFISWRLTIDGTAGFDPTGASGRVTVTGMPFTALPPSSTQPHCGPMQTGVTISNWASATGPQIAGAYTSEIRLFFIDNASNNFTTNIDVTDMSTASGIRNTSNMAGWYFVA